MALNNFLPWFVLSRTIFYGEIRFNLRHAFFVSCSLPSEQIVYNIRRRSEEETKKVAVK
jgi:hypothetical protein